MAPETLQYLVIPERQEMPVLLATQVLRAQRELVQHQVAPHPLHGLDSQDRQAR